jgi:serine/threonine-protein kinase
MPGVSTERSERPGALPGAILDGRYHLKRRISAGGMGEVWAAAHLSLGCEVALKLLRAELISDHEHRARFRREAVVLTRLRTERVARVLDYFIDPTLGPALVMELIHGANLATRAAMRRWSVEQAIDLGIELAQALIELHRAHIIHRDIKPANVVLSPREDGTERVVLVDFGVSRLVQEDSDDDTALTSITGNDGGVGTLQYMAPEQLLGARKATGQSDIYGVGAVLFRAVTGEYVFPDLEGTELAKAKLSRESPTLTTGRWDRMAIGFRDVVRRALRRDPVERYASADELLHDLVALRNGRAAALSFRVRPARHSRTLVALGISAATLLGYALGSSGRVMTTRTAGAASATSVAASGAP